MKTLRKLGTAFAAMILGISLIAQNSNESEEKAYEIDCCDTNDWVKASMVKHAADAPQHDAMVAFECYLEYYNNGRPYILAGHSQGSMSIPSMALITSCIITTFVRMQGNGSISS